MKHLLFLLSFLFIFSIDNYGQNITWQDLENVQLSGINGIEKTGATGWNNAVASSLEVIPAGSDGFFEYTLSNTTAGFTLGVSNENNNGTFESVDYAIFASGQWMWVYKNGQQIYAHPTPVIVTTNNKYRIERSGNSLVFSYSNAGGNAILFTIPDAQTGDLIADVNISANGGIIDNCIISVANSSGGGNDMDWVTTNGSTPSLLTEDIYSMGKVGIGESNPSARLQLSGAFCDGSPILKITQPATACPFPNKFGNLLEIETEDLFSSSYVNRFLVTQSGRVGINQEEPLADLEVGGQGIMVIDAFSNAHCGLNRRSGLYFRRDFSPFGWANDPNQLKNMSIRPRGLCSSENQDGLEINGYDGVVLSTGAQDRLAITQSGSVKIGFNMPDCTGERDVPGCWNGFLLEVNGEAAKPGGGSWIALSDKRMKKNINQFKDGLEVIKKIKPVKYHYNKSSGFDSKKEHIGVIAQDLKKIAPYMVQNDFKTSRNSEQYYTIDPSTFDYLLINSVKEQQEIIESNTEEMEQLKAEISELKTTIQSICNDGCGNLSRLQNTGTSNIPSYWDKIKLEQNTPNPFNSITSINYYLPDEVQNAAIIIYDLQGKQVKKYNIQNSGAGNIEVNLEDLYKGMYLYGLLIDGQTSATLKMISIE